MEELILRLFASREELDIVDDEEVDLLIVFLEFVDLLVPYRFHQFARESFGSDVFYDFFRVVRLHLVSQGLKKVCFPESDASIYEKRVVGAPKVL